MSDDDRVLGDVPSVPDSIWDALLARTFTSDPPDSELLPLAAQDDGDAGFAFEVNPEHGQHDTDQGHRPGHHNDHDEAQSNGPSRHDGLYWQAGSPGGDGDGDGGDGAPHIAFDVHEFDPGPDDDGWSADDQLV